MKVDVEVEPGIADQQTIANGLSKAVVRAGYEIRSPDERPAPGPRWQEPEPEPNVVVLRARAMTWIRAREQPIPDSEWPLGVTLDLPTGETLISANHPPSQLESLCQWVTDSLLELGQRFQIPIVIERSISVRTERLVDVLLAELEAENSALRTALEEANLRAAFLEGQLHAVLEAKSSGKKRILMATLSVVGAVLLSLAGGAAQGVGQSAADTAFARASTAKHAAECEALQHLIRQSEIGQAP